MKYCMHCGRVLSAQEVEGMKVPYCEACDQLYFHRFNTAVSMIVINQNNEILLIQQYHRPYYILVAGYVNPGEMLEETCVRELQEEIGLEAESVVYLRSQFYAHSDTLMVNFAVKVKGDDLSKLNREEVDAAQWHTADDALKAIKPDSLAAYFLNAYVKENNP